MNDYDRKYAAALDELAKTGIWRSNSNPPYLRLLRSIGQRPRPPHYQVFKRNFIGHGLWFAVCWGLLMWFFFWRTTDMTILLAFVSAGFAGVFYGLIMAAYYSNGQRKHRLTRWDDL